MKNKIIIIGLLLISILVIGGYFLGTVDFTGDIEDLEDSETDSEKSNEDNTEQSE